MAGLNINKLPQYVRDTIELKEATDPTFSRFVDNDYTEIFFDILNQRRNNPEHCIIISMTGLQGCHAKGALITTKNGLKKIEDVKLGELVWSGNAWRMCIPVNKGVQNICGVKLTNGQLMKMTYDHVMKTERGWVEAKDLVKGDSFILGNVPWSSEWNEDSEKAVAIGMMLADGHMDKTIVREKYDYIRKSSRSLKKSPKIYHEYEKKRLRFYNLDRSVHKRFTDILNKYYGSTASGSYEDVFKGVRRSTVTCIQNSDVCDKIENAGVTYGHKSYLVRIPEWILNSDAAMNGFLAGYFVCDGSFYGKTEGGKCIEITTCSKELSSQLSAWLQSKGVGVKVITVLANGNNAEKYRVFIKGTESLQKWCLSVKNISEKKKVYVPEKKIIWSKKSVSEPVIEEIFDLGVDEVYDLEVADVHEYLVNGLVSHNSGKSFSAVSLSCYLDPKFSPDRVFFGYNDLVYHRQDLPDNCCVMVDEQSQTYGIDAHRIMIVLQNLKEQLRKRGISFIFCSPTLYEESKSSMFIIETIFIDEETQEVVAALKDRDGLVYGHVRIPHPLKPIDEQGGLATPELIKSYQAKKDGHLETVLGRDAKDQVLESAEEVMKHKMFIKAEKIYVDRYGYVPQGSLQQLINMIFPEFNAGVMTAEIAGRVRLIKEMTGVWELSGHSTKSKKDDDNKSASKKKKR